MAEKVEKVRQVLAAAEDVGMDGVPTVHDDQSPAPPDGHLGGGDGGDPPNIGGQAPPYDEEPERRPPGPAGCVGLPLNDYGNGQRFAHLWGRDLMFVPRIGWFTWTGQVWRIDPDLIAVRRLGQQLGQAINDEIEWMRHTPEDEILVSKAQDYARETAELEAVPEGERSDENKSRLKELDRLLSKVRDARSRLSKAKQAVRRHAQGAGNSPKIKAAIGESETVLACSLNELDSDPLMVNCETGTLKFTVDCDTDGRKVADVKLLDHDRDHRLTNMVTAGWDRQSTCPRFDAFMERIQPDPVMRQFLQRWFGLSMTALKKQNMAFFYGSGANGKSVLVDLIANMLGDYCATANVESLTGHNRKSGSDATPDLVPLIGARMVRASEPEEGERLAEAKIKALTGGEPINVRQLNEGFVEVLPYFKLTLSGNHKPEIRGNDNGIWRRVMLVPFGVEIPDEEQDLDLPEKLWEERDGILQWLADGLIGYLENGLQIPDEVLAATSEYRAESDPLGQFLHDCVVATGDPADAILSLDLTHAFNYYRQRNGQDTWKGTTIQRKMPAQAAQWRDRKTGHGMTKGKSSKSQYVGIKWNDMFRRELLDAERDRDGKPIARMMISSPQKSDDGADF